MKNIIFILSIFLNSFVFSQVGINTDKPLGIFHVDAKADNNNMINTENLKNDIVVSNSFGTEAYMGIGNSSPKVKLDVRGDDTSVGSAIAVGYSNISAEEAGAGAIRWNNNNNYLQYSNGYQWINIQSTKNTQKAIVVANKSDLTQIHSEEGISLGWNNVIFDNSNSFYPGENMLLNNDLDISKKSHFTAPRDGVYLTNFTFAIKSKISNSYSRSQIENIWELRTESNEYKRNYKCVNSFPANTSNNQDILIGSNCLASFYMHRGEKLYPIVWLRLIIPDSPVYLLKDPSYNTLIIVEQ